MAVAGRTHTKLTGAPDYDSSEFWDAKFATSRDVGEWLNSGEILLEAVLSDLGRRPRFEGGSPRVLHLGPGVSKLGVKLRDAYAERQWKGNGIVVSPKGELLASPPLLTLVSSAERGLLGRSHSPWSSCRTSEFSRTRDALGTR